MAARTSIAASLLIVGLAGACNRRAEPTAGAAEATAASFPEVFSLTDSVVLQQPDSAPVVRISGLDVDASGQIALGDVSEGNVKVFAPDGRLLRIIGRKGGGPGEFTAPRYPRWGPDGLLHVADAQDPRIQAFDAFGRVAHAIRLPDAGMIMGMEPLASGAYLVLAEQAGRRTVLLEVQRDGRVSREFLSIAGVLPAGQADFEGWSTFRGYFVDVVGDSAYVSNTLSDTLWTVHLPSGVEARRQVLFPGYIRPTHPAQRPLDIAALLKWSHSFHLGSVLSADRGFVYVPYVQGVLNNGDRMLLVARNRRGEWRAVSGAPPIIAAENGRAVALLTPGEEQVKLGFLTPRW